MLHAYLELKLAWELYQKAPETLSQPERNRLSDVAAKQDSIEQAILASPQAANVVVPTATLRTRVQEIRQRYPDNRAFAQDLERLDMSEADLDKAVERDLCVEAVLEQIVSTVPAVSLVDAEIYYRLHPEAFDQPEARRLRHILITYDKPDDRSKAVKTLENLRSTAISTEKFSTAALRYSQCPTAVDGGLLGVVKRQQLYSELEAPAFALLEGEISAVIESPIGLHIVRCDEILPSGLLPFGEVSQKIIERLGEKRRQETQRLWIKQLLSGHALT
jgi:peptidyl-prolyl cis-trans isomerase C